MTLWNYLQSIRNTLVGVEVSSTYTRLIKASKSMKNDPQLFDRRSRTKTQWNTKMIVTSETSCRHRVQNGTKQAPPHKKNSRFAFCADPSANSSFASRSWPVRRVRRVRPAGRVPVGRLPFPDDVAPVVRLVARIGRRPVARAAALGQRRVGVGVQRRRRWRRRSVAVGTPHQELQRPQHRHQCEFDSLDFSQI